MSPLRIAVAVLVALAARPAPSFGPGEGRAIVVGQLEEILKGARIRDYAPFETERGEGALLVLYATDAVDPPDDATLPADADCATRVTGIPLLAHYHVALVVRGALVDTVDVPSDGLLALPLANRGAANARDWGQATDDPGGLQDTRLVKLADYTGDGNAWEFRLVRPHGCGAPDTLLAGYSARQRRAILYPVVRDGDPSVWNPGFFPPPDAPDARRITVLAGCDGAARGRREKYVFDPARDAWRRARVRAARCPAAPSEPLVDERVLS